MQMNAFRAIRFNSDYWRFHKELDVTSNAIDKVKQTENILTYLNSQIANGIAKIDSVPGIYVIRTTSGSKSITSIIGEIDYNEKSVLFVNEGTHPQKLEHYKSMFQKFKIQTSPVLTFYINEIPIDEIVNEILHTPKTVTANINGMLYELWYINTSPEINKIKQALKPVERLYIADGHHRFSLFSSVVSKLSAKLIISVTDANSILLKSCHKIVCGSISANWQEKILQFGHIAKINSFKDTVGKIILVFPNGENFVVEYTESEVNKNIFDIVKKNIIEIGLGVNNYEENVFPLPGNVSPNDADKIFNLYKNAAVAIFVPSINIGDFLDAIDNGHKLPATSTWFEPKIVDGFIVGKF